MQIQVSGRGVDVGEALRSHIQSRVDEHVNKYIDRVNSIQAVIARDAHLFRVDIVGNVGTHSGFVIRSRGESTDVYASFDDALEKVSKQLRRYKRKITNHHKDSPPELHMVTATKRVVSPQIGEEDEDKGGLVIAEKPTAIETLTVSQAVMKMDLQHLPALLFFNKAHGRLNVVYRREDGNISWVDPDAKAA
ncbi:MAG: ribosome-associated translation inhibitor RaiA [Alphaproteobacteria bacterium]|nr:ribosome-associated translation inhibitor RaiA [Alphaproteobacteria bacterium]